MKLIQQKRRFFIQFLASLYLRIYTAIEQYFMRFCLFSFFLECCNDSSNIPHHRNRWNMFFVNSYCTTHSLEVGYNAHSPQCIRLSFSIYPFHTSFAEHSNLTWSCAVCVAHWVRVVTNAKKIHKKSIFLQWLGAVESEKHTFPRHQLFALIFAPYG